MTKKSSRPREFSARVVASIGKAVVNEDGAVRCDAIEEWRDGGVWMVNG